MKTTRFLILTLALAIVAGATFTSCDKGDDGPDAGDGTVTFENSPGIGSMVYVTDYTLSGDTDLQTVADDNIAYGVILSGNVCEFAYWDGSNTGTFNVLVRGGDGTRAESGSVIKYQNGVQFTNGSASLDWNGMTELAGGGTDPGGDPDVDFTIYVNETSEWTPFPGEADVVFTNSDNTILDIEDDGTTVEFTGIQVGESTITAKFGEQTLTAIVYVRTATGGGGGEGDGLKAATIHYLHTELSVSLCFDNGGEQRRCEMIDTEGEVTIGIYNANGDCYVYAPTEDGYIWFPNQYVDAEETKLMAKTLSDAYFADTYQYVITMYEQYHSFMPDLFSKTSGQIVGQTCDIYDINYDGDSGSFGFWQNTVMLRIRANEESIEADYARTGCPENAFDQVVEINWGF